MPKKFRFLLISFTTTLLLYHLSATSTSAVCIEPINSNICLAGTTLCIGQGVCCATPQECNDYEPPKPNPTCTAPAGMPSGAGINYVNTALGCLPTDPSELLKLLLPWAFGIGGTIAFLLILYGSFQYITASGKPEQMEKAKEAIVSAITGLVIIVFSVTILKIIGVDILRLSGFTYTQPPEKTDNPQQGPIEVPYEP